MELEQRTDVVQIYYVKGPTDLRRFVYFWQIRIFNCPPTNNAPIRRVVVEFDTSKSWLLRMVKGNIIPPLPAYRTSVLIVAQSIASDTHFYFEP